MLCSSRIIPYFRNLGVTLGDLKAVHIQAFYQEQLERVKPNTVIHYHAVIHRALKYAVKTDLIDVNPADKVDRPKKNEFTGNFYSKDETNALFDAVRGSKIEVAVMLTAFYGLRRSEVVSLQFVPDYLAKLSSAAHPLSRFAPLLRQFAFGKRCPDEDDSGVAGTQRFLYHREYLFAFGLRFQGFFSRSNAERAWNGFKSGK